MAFVTISDDIIVQEGTFGFSFIASSNISGGQLVKSTGPNSDGGLYVSKSTTSVENPIGIAAYTVTAGEAVTVYGPGNIIRGCAASATTAGDDLTGGIEGTFSNTIAIGGVNPTVGISLEGKNANGTMRILLK